MYPRAKIKRPDYFYLLRECTSKIIIQQGGTSSGKTYTTLDVLFDIALHESNKVITIVGQDVPNLKKGAYRDAKNLWSSREDYQEYFDKPNETERVFKCKTTGSILEFSSYQDEQDAKSGKRDYLFINEANGIQYMIYWQLAIRTKERIFIDYNPTARFWAHDLIGTNDVSFFRTWHIHNIFLTEEQHQRIEGIEDEELFKVYARGLTGQIRGLIYSNWGVVENMPTEFKKRWIGIDFGFTNDPTAIVDVMLSNGELYIDEVAYDYGLTNPDIAEIVKNEGLSQIGIIADSAEPKSIAELNGLGLKVEGAIKGADSITNGIDILKRYRMNITRRSINIKKELESYKWKEDRNGKVLNIPIDDFNHALDPIRYIALNSLNKVPKKKGIKKISGRNYVREINPIMQ